MTGKFRSRGFATKAGLALLHSPFGRWMRASTAELRYTGRRSGVAIALPVAYTRAGEQVVVLVGQPDGKTWWRNFRVPREVEIELPEGSRVGLGRALEPADSGYVQARERYRGRFPRTPAAGREPLIVIELGARG